MSGDPLKPAAEPSAGNQVALPLVEMRDLGICYHLRRRKHVSLKEMLVTRRWESAPLLWALRHVDLVCHEGQTLGIVGRNGAGKSTLCLALAQILSQDEGEVIVRGEISTLLSLNAALQRHLTGRENIYLFGALLGIPRDVMKDRVPEIAEFSELGEFLDQPVRFYSSGMRARLGFSVATSLNPQILILDEVLNVGDRAFRAKSRQRMDELMAQSKLIVIVSHSSVFLRSVCTHGLWLEKGRVRMYGPAREVIDAYDTATGGIDPEPDTDGS